MMGLMSFTKRHQSELAGPFQHARHRTRPSASQGEALTQSSVHSTLILNLQLLELSKPLWFKSPGL